MSHYSLPSHGCGPPRTLHRLTREARTARLLRMHERFPSPCPGDVALIDDLRRRRAAQMVERMLRCRSSGTINCARFFATLATRLQVASGVIETMMSSVAGATLDAARTRNLATVIADLVYYFEAAVPNGGSTRVYLAIAYDDDRLIVGVGAEGDINPVSTLSASAAMLRARSIVQLMHGEFQRGVADNRLLFGLTFSNDFATPVES